MFTFPRPLFSGRLGSRLNFRSTARGSARISCDAEPPAAVRRIGPLPDTAEYDAKTAAVGRTPLPVFIQLPQSVLVPGPSVVSLSSRKLQVEEYDCQRVTLSLEPKERLRAMATLNAGNVGGLGVAAQCSCPDRNRRSRLSRQEHGAFENSGLGPWLIQSTRGVEFSLWTARHTR